MTDKSGSYKHVIQSKTVQASIISLISSLILYGTSHSVNDKYFAITTALSSLFAIYGRLTAEHKLYYSKKHLEKQIKKESENGNTNCYSTGNS